MRCRPGSDLEWPDGGGLPDFEGVPVRPIAHVRVDTPVEETFADRIQDLLEPKDPQPGVGETEREAEGVVQVRVGEEHVLDLVGFGARQAMGEGAGIHQDRTGPKRGCEAARSRCARNSERFDKNPFAHVGHSILTDRSNRPYPSPDMDEATSAASAAKSRTNGEPLLKIDGLCTFFHTDEGVVKSVNGVSYEAAAGETVGVVGESGCGKSVTALSIMRLIPMPPGRIEAGSIWFDGEDLVKVSAKRMRQIRGGKIGMIFQEPMTSLNPVFTVGNQIEEAVKIHLKLKGRDARDRAIEMLQKVGIPSPEQRVDEYPHQLSGGMRQRVMIAMALSCNPKLLIADEPTTALDVTIQAQILELIRGLQEELGMSVLMITHDLGVIAETAHRVVVMYASKIVEMAEVKDLFGRPRHPYTRGLFRSIPSMTGDRTRLETIPGTVPNPLEFAEGCKFHNRCEFASEHCVSHEPPLREISPGHFAACWLHEPDGPMYDPEKVS